MEVLPWLNGRRTFHGQNTENETFAVSEVVVCLLNWYQWDCWLVTGWTRVLRQYLLWEAWCTCGEPDLELSMLVSSSQYHQSSTLYTYPLTSKAGKLLDLQIIPFRQG